MLSGQSPGLAALKKRDHQPVIKTDSHVTKNNQSDENTLMQSNDRMDQNENTEILPSVVQFSLLKDFKNCAEMSSRYTDVAS